MPAPNIVIIMTDQQRADFSKAEGFALDTMPFVDALAARGQRFARAYTPMPVCAPARCSMFTGRFPKATTPRPTPLNWADRRYTKSFMRPMRKCFGGRGRG